MHVCMMANVATYEVVYMQTLMKNYKGRKKLFIAIMQLRFLSFTSLYLFPHIKTLDCIQIPPMEKILTLLMAHFDASFVCLEAATSSFPSDVKCVLSDYPSQGQLRCG